MDGLPDGMRHSAGIALEKLIHLRQEQAVELPDAPVRFEYGLRAFFQNQPDLTILEAYCL